MTATDTKTDLGRQMRDLRQEVEDLRRQVVRLNGDVNLLKRSVPGARP